MCKGTAFLMNYQEQQKKSLNLETLQRKVRDSTHRASATVSVLTQVAEADVAPATPAGVRIL